MSDVSYAPPPSAPAPAAQPATNEVPINPNPTHMPTPVGPQAPDKPAAEADSRRDTIKRAYDKVTQEPVKTRRGMGDNNPPEPMAKEKPKAEPPARVDLRKRPTDQRPVDAQPREQGRFASSSQNVAERRTTSQQPGPQPAQQQAQPQPNANDPIYRPPSRMDPQAKADWPKTPASIRASVHRMHTEFAKAYNYFRRDHEVMETIRPYHDMAQKHGTTLDRALNNYVSMENKLRSDVVGGLDIIVNNLNLRTEDGKKITLHDVAYHILNQSPEQQKLVQSENHQTALSHQIGQLHQIVSGLAQHQQAMQYRQQFKDTRSALDRHVDAGRHPRFDELGPAIEREIKLGFDLDTAYRRAELLHPAAAAQTRTAAPQTRTPDRSIHGAPDGGPANGHFRRAPEKQSRSPREAIASAMRRVGV